MDYEHYLETFRRSVDGLDNNMLNKKHLETYVGVTLKSVVLKLYKKEWTNDQTDPVNARTRIFFAVWVNEETIKQNKLFYNIHALKLRELEGYSIASRDFADKFREKFREFWGQWNNVSVKFGPLTLMEGWEEFEAENLQNMVLKLADNFCSIDHLIDNTLEKFKLVKNI